MEDVKKLENKEISVEEIILRPKRKTTRKNLILETGI